MEIFSYIRRAAKIHFPSGIEAGFKYTLLVPNFKPGDIKNS